MRHVGRVVHETSAIYPGTESAVFVCLFEEDLLRQMHLELALIHSTVHEECIELTTSPLMIKCETQKGHTKATLQWIGEASKIRCTVCPWCVFVTAQYYIE
jgi:hypothetical protein